jgi:hypothetical protein
VKQTAASLLITQNEDPTPAPTIPAAVLLAEGIRGGRPIEICSQKFPKLGIVVTNDDAQQQPAELELGLRHIICL